MKNLNIPNATVCFKNDIEYDIFEWQLLDRLISEINWQEKPITIYGRTMLQPRLVAWYGNTSYEYSGTKMMPEPYIDILEYLHSVVEEHTQCTYNSVLLNYYRDGNDSIGMHSDDEKELGPSPNIASLSFGETRKFILQGEEKFEIPLTSGSLLFMGGDTQKNYKHGIPKEKNKGPRVNLTFRTIYNE